MLKSASRQACRRIFAQPGLRSIRQRVDIYLKAWGGHNRQRMSGKDWPGACKELLLKWESVHLQPVIERSENERSRIRITKI